MRFPLDQRILTRGAAAHVAAGLGAACDYRADHVPFFAPCEGTVYHFGDPTNGGGYWMGFRRGDGVKLELAHLSRRDVPNGATVREGQHCGITGNTGTITSGPHLHLQIIEPNGHRIDPELLNWTTLTPTQMAIQQVVDAQKKTLKNVQDGIVAGAVDASTGKAYIIKNSKKIEKPIIEVLASLYVPYVKQETLNDIPNG